jgi:hypothetical protein
MRSSMAMLVAASTLSSTTRIERFLAPVGSS